MKNGMVVIALLLALPFNAYALTCKDIEPGGRNREKNMDKVWKAAEKMGLGWGDRMYETLVYEICSGDEKMLNLSVSEGTFSSKEVAAYRKILNKPKTTDEFPPIQEHYIKSDEMKIGYPSTMNSVLECFEQSGPERNYSCPDIVGVLRGDNEFKKLYEQYWLKTGRKIYNDFEMLNPFLMVNYRGKKYLHFSQSCKTFQCNEKTKVSDSEMLYDISGKRIIGYFTDVNYNPQITGPYNKDEKELLQRMVKKNGITGVVEKYDPKAAVVNIK